MQHPVIQIALDPALRVRSTALALRLGVTLEALVAQGLSALLERYAPLPAPVGDQPSTRAPTASGVKRWKRTDLRRRGLEIPSLA